LPGLTIKTTDGKHMLFWRGALENLFNPQAPFLPGSPPEQTVVDHSKGFADESLLARV